MDSMENNVLAIIPTQQSAQDIYTPYLCMLAGKPLLAHIIERAKSSKGIGRIVVSTDDPEISRVSQQYGVEAIWLSIDNLNDMEILEFSLLHVVNYLQKCNGYEPDLCVALQYRMPLTLPEDIEGIIRTLQNDEADSALSVTPFRSRLWQRDEMGNTINRSHNEQTNFSFSRFSENGAVYVMHTQGFKKARRRFFGKVATYVMPPNRSLMINEHVDLQIAEALIREQQKFMNIQRLPDCIDALVLDFDGVFTDNKVIVFEDGREAVICDRGDGWGLAQLKKLSIPTLVISTEENPVVNARCKKLGIPYLQGVREKLTALTSWLKTNKMDISRVVYLGNDVNDLSCIRAVGCGIGVHNSHPQILAAAKIVLSVPGGQGAIRELAELIEHKYKENKDAKHD
jgi:N-acylneuraminate cytidylyltransferase